MLGDGAPASCTGDAVIAAVAAGGVIPITIVLASPPRSSTTPVIDGGGKVALSGGNTSRHAALPKTKTYNDGDDITHNTGGTWYTQYPQISAHDDAPITVTDSTIEN